MKILTITARFPPGHAGGYEIRCKNIVDALSRRGHDIRVVTSYKKGRGRCSGAATPYPVLRLLHDDFYDGRAIDWLTRRRSSYVLGMLLASARELFFGARDTGKVSQLIELFRPDAIYVSHTYTLSKLLLPYLSTCGAPLVYDEGGIGLIEAWEEKGVWYKFTGEIVPQQPVAKVLKFLVVEATCRLSGGRLKSQWAWPGKMRIFFNDELGLRNAVAHGVPVDGAKVIHSGVDTEKFSFRPRPRLSMPIRIIIPGRMEPRKGQMDGVRLLAALRDQGLEAHLTVVGATGSEQYRSELIDEVRRLQLENQVRFMPMVPHEDLAALYREAGMCFFPSYYKTGFSRVPLEAMASGCIVISYGNEGSDEIIRDRHNGFLVPPADYEGIAAIGSELLSYPERVANISATARREIEAEFSLKKYTDRVEQLIVGAVETS